MKLLATLYSDYDGIAKLLEGLRRADIGCETRTVTEESGLAAVQILVDEAHYDAACEVVDALRRKHHADPKGGSPDVTRERDRPGYETLGRFEVPDARRIIDRLNEEHIPFKIEAPFEVHPIPTPYRHPHWLYIYVRPEFKKRADEIVLEGSNFNDLTNR